MLKTINVYTYSNIFVFVFGNLDYLFLKKNGSCKPKYWTDVTHTFVTQE